MRTNSMDRWKGKVALVTGASSGIGRATASLLASEGLRVVLAARDAGRLDTLKSEIQGQGGQALAIPVDLSQESGISQLFAEIRQSWGGVDVLINNAGLGFAGTLNSQNPDDWRAMLDLNVMALSICTQQALKDMEQRPEGYIIHISSIVGHRMPPTGNTFYAATKHAVVGLTEGLRMELQAKESKVRVSAISPGLVETEFSERAKRMPGDTSAYRQFKVLEAMDIAQMVLYLLSTPHHVQIHDIVLRPREQGF